MVQPCDYPKLRDLLDESIRTGQPILIDGHHLLSGPLYFNEEIDRYTVRKPPPEPKWRPWTEAEIEAECIKGTVIRYEHGRLKPAIGPISVDGHTVYCGRSSLCSIGDGDWILQRCVIAATGAPCGVLETPESVATQG